MNAADNEGWEGQGRLILFRSDCQRNPETVCDTPDRMRLVLWRRGMVGAQ